MRDLRFLGVLACFLLSGFAGLLYQTAWTRQFSFVFGTSSLAVATVLAAYMGGMAGGAALAARFVVRLRRPLLVYGLLEGGIALSALAVPLAMDWAGALRLAWLGGVGIPDEGAAGTAVFYLVVSFLVLFVPTALMGATLPLLTRHAVREQAQVGRRIGALYSANTLGAVFGVLATAFLLLPRLGIERTIWVGVAMNGLVFCMAWLLSRAAQEPPPASRPDSRGESLLPHAGGFLVVAFGAGVASFTFEVLWTRLFEHVLGGSVYAFATMLASFLIGIALGAAIASRLARSPANAARGLALSLAGAAIFSLLAYHWAQHLPEIAAALEAGDPLRRLLTLSFYSGALLLPSTLCIGASFPFVVRAIVARPEASANASARVYAWNTLGAIFGAVGAGFIVIPWLGFAGTMRAAVGLEIALAAAAALLLRPIGWSGLVAAGAGIATLVLLPPTPPWPLLRSRPSDLIAQGNAATGDIVYYGVGRGSTVLMTRDDRFFRLWTNGLPEASIGMTGERPGNALTARWLGALPALRPGGSKRVLVIGLGGGVALESLPASIERIDVIELEPEVVLANRAVSELRAIDPLADPRVRLSVNDARGALQLSRSTWDAIVSQPSHPWTAGASHLYTREFLELVKQRLEPDGVFVQWIGLGFIDEALLRSLAATIQASFSNVRVYDLGGLLFLASNAPLATREQELAQVAADPQVFARLGVLSGEDLAIMQVLDEAGVRRLAAGAPLVRDDDNLLATRAPLLPRDPSGRAVRDLLQRYDPLGRNLDGLDVVYLTRRLVERGKKARAERFSGSLAGEQAVRLAAQGIVHRAFGRRRKALRSFAAAAKLDPSLVEARFWVAQTTPADAPERMATLDAGERAIPLGARLRREQRWTELAALEEPLANIGLRHPGGRAARELRIDWRLQEGPARAEEAMRLLEFDAFGWGPGRHARRAHAAALLSRREAALFSLRELADARWPAAAGSAIVAEHALAALGLLPGDAVSEQERSALRDTFLRHATTARKAAEARQRVAP